MHVIQARAQIVTCRRSIARHHHRLVARPEDMAPETMSLVKAPDVGVLKPVHTAHQIGLGCLQHPVVMIAAYAGLYRPWRNHTESAKPGKSAGLTRCFFRGIIRYHCPPPVSSGNTTSRPVRFIMIDDRLRHRHISVRSGPCLARLPTVGFTQEFHRRGCQHRCNQS
jgi:hypothetical protein